VARVTRRLFHLGTGAIDWGFNTNFQQRYEAILADYYAQRAAEFAKAVAAENAPPMETRPEETGQVDAVPETVPIPAEEAPPDDKPESLHDVVAAAAATKPGKPDEDTFTTSLESPTKGANAKDSVLLEQVNAGLTYIHPAVAEILPDTGIPPVFETVPLPAPAKHDGASMALEPSAYQDGIVDIEESSSRTSDKLVPGIPMVGPIEPNGAEIPNVGPTKDTSAPFVPVAVASTDGMTKFLKPAGMAVAVGAGVAGLCSAIWLGNKLLEKLRGGSRSKKRKAGKQRERRHVRDWNMQ
jgi:hypothetical protein